VWHEDLRLALEEVDRLKRASALPSGCRLEQVDFDDDPDMLYLRLADGERALGALFARNSGTENRSAVYARGLADFETPLGQIVRRLNDNHIHTMKDDRLVETRASEALAQAVEADGAMSMTDAQALAAEHGITGEAQFHALLFALGREGRIRRLCDEVHAVETN
jgi:hypothetical protein